MDIILSNKRSSLRLSYNIGLNEKGEPIARSKTYSNVKADATVENIYAVAQAFAELQVFPLIMVSRTEQAELQEI